MTTATEALTGYFKRLTEVKEQELALKQRQYEEVSMKREEQEIYKKMEAETLYYQSKTGPTGSIPVIKV